MCQGCGASMCFQIGSIQNWLRRNMATRRACAARPGCGMIDVINCEPLKIQSSQRLIQSFVGAASAANNQCSRLKPLLRIIDKTRCLVVK